MGLAYSDDVVGWAEEIGPHVSTLRFMIKQDISSNFIHHQTDVEAVLSERLLAKRSVRSCYHSFPNTLYVPSRTTPTSSSECRWSR